MLTVHTTQIERPASALKAVGVLTHRSFDFVLRRQSAIRRVIGGDAKKVFLTKVTKVL